MKAIKKHKYHFTDISFTVPAFLIFVCVLLIPLITTFIAAFTEWNGIKGNMKFNGIQNFIKILSPSTSSWKALGFSFKFTFAAVVLTNLIAILLALVITGRMYQRTGHSFKGAVPQGCIQVHIR